MLESYTTLGALASAIEKIQLSMLVTGNTYRNPTLLTKAVTTPLSTGGVPAVGKAQRVRRSLDVPANCPINGADPAQRIWAPALIVGRLVVFRSDLALSRERRHRSSSASSAPADSAAALIPVSTSCRCSSSASSTPSRSTTAGGIFVAWRRNLTPFGVNSA
jgi:hypothetical protein